MTEDNEQEKKPDEGSQDSEKNEKGEEANPAVAESQTPSNGISRLFGKPSWLSGTALVFVVTALGYVLGFAHEVGYLSHYGIYADFTEVGLSSLVKGMVLLCFTLTFIGGVNLLNFSDKHALVGYASFVGICVCIWGYIRLSSNSFFALSFMIVLLAPVTVLAYIIPEIPDFIAIYRKRPKTKYRFFQCHDRVLNRMMEYFKTHKRILILYALALFFAIVIINESYGQRYAETQTEYYCIEDAGIGDGKLVVIKKQASCLLCMKLKDEESGELEAGLVIIPTDNKTIQMKLEKIGPLKVAPLEEKDDAKESP